MSLTDDIGTGLERARGSYLNLQAAASWCAFSLDSVCEEAYEIAAAEVDRKLAINIFRKFCQIRGRNLVHCGFNWSVSFVYFDQLFYDRGGNTQIADLDATASAVTPGASSPMTAVSATDAENGPQS